MIFFFGLRLFGRVDAVPGRFHVATEFYHVQFIPIVPMQTWLITSENGNGWEGIKLPLCRKSVAVAWVRAACVVTAFFAAIWALVEAARPFGDWRAAAAVCLVAAAVFAATKLSQAINHATCQRACDLARLAGLRERAIAEIREQYGQAPGDAGDDTAAGAEPAEAAPQMFFVSARDGSGQEVCVTVWAKDAQAARDTTAGRGLLVSSVESAAPAART
jgi:hypothetical protein